MPMPNHLLLDRTATRPSRGLVIPHAGHAVVPPTASGSESTAMPSIAGWMKSWGRNAADWVHSASERLGGAAREERIFHELADVVQDAREPMEIESALMRLACRMSGARHAELVLESHPGAGAGLGGATPVPYRRLIARWPEAVLLDAPGNAAGNG